jgi:hypothetical protein
MSITFKKSTLRAAATLFAADPSAVSIAVKRALADAGLIDASAAVDPRGRKAADTKELLIKFANGEVIGAGHRDRLIEAGFVKVAELRKNVRGRPTPVYALTGKGKSHAAIYIANAARKAAKEATKTAAAA